jgi:hypothetical protein
MLNTYHNTVIIQQAMATIGMIRLRWLRELDANTRAHIRADLNAYASEIASALTGADLGAFLFYCRWAFSDVIDWQAIADVLHEPRSVVVAMAEGIAIG